MEIKRPGDAPLPPVKDTAGGSQTSTANTAVSRATTAVGWQTGQILDALVVKATSDTLTLNIQGQLAQVTNKIANQPLPNQTGNPLIAGQKLAVQVMALEPQIQMRVHNPRATAPQITELGKALRDLLPRQQPLPPLMANIEAIARKTHTIPPMPKEIKTLGWEMYRHLPEPRQISTPTGLKQALQNLGPFLENSLLGQSRVSANNIEQNIRTSLLRLATALRQGLGQIPGQGLVSSSKDPATLAAPQTTNLTTPQTGHIPGQLSQQSGATTGQPADKGVKPNSPQPQGASNASLQTLAAQENGMEELLRQVDAALARMSVQQLHTAQATEQGRLMWLLELPVRTNDGIDLFDMRIHTDDEQTSEQIQNKPWTVNLAFDLQGLGPVRASVTLLDETVTARFWAEQTGTSRLFSENMDMLRSQLNHAGLEVGKLDCETGIPDEAPGTLPTTSVLDEKA